MLSDVVLLADSLEVKVLDSTISRAILINGYLFREELSGWVYVGSIVKKGKNNSSIRLYNKFFEAKPANLDLGVDEKNFYPHRTLPTEVGQRLIELYEFYKSHRNN